MRSHPLSALSELRATGRSVWLGLMSGTSGDGIDAARVELEEAEAAPRVLAIDGMTRAYSARFRGDLRTAVESAGSFADAARWDRILGDQFAEAAEDAIARFGPVDAVALSGHTFSHRPIDDPPATLQLGNPAVVAAATDKPVLFGFRAADLARGGEGAPLVPAGDRVLFGGLGDPIAVVNIGGISNVTWLHRGDAPTAVDAGPGNLVLDATYRAGARGAEAFDRDGRVAATGRTDRDWLAHLIEATETRGASVPRRSYGREEFGGDALESLGGVPVTLTWPDRLATLCAWVAHNIAEAVTRLAGDHAPARVLVGGGGAHHRVLIAELSSRLGLPAEPLDEARHGVGADLRESAAFAILGNEWLYDRPGSFSGTTGARFAGPLGELALP